MNPLVQIRPRPFLAFGLIATFGLVGAQQTASTPAKCAMDELMENSECMITTVTERSDAFYQGNPQFNRDAFPAFEKAVGFLTNSKGKRVLREVVKGTNPAGEKFTKSSLLSWNGTKGDMRVWFEVEGKERTDREEKDLKRDPTLDPTNWSYRILGSTVTQLLSLPGVRSHPNCLLTLIEGPIGKGSFKAWYVPDSSNPFERIELESSLGGKFLRVTVTKSKNYLGVSLPEEIAEETYANAAEKSNWLTRTTMTMTGWKFGSLKEPITPPGFLPRHYTNGQNSRVH